MQISPSLVIMGDTADYSLTDCPRCKSLCFGPSILPCGHLLCKKCLRHELSGSGRVFSQKDLEAVCPFCRTPLNGDDRYAHRFKRDFIMEELVAEEAAKQTGAYECCIHPGRKASVVCIDCGEMYCNGCSNVHKKMAATRCHDQQLLHPASAPLGDGASAGGFKTTPVSLGSLADNNQNMLWEEQNLFSEADLLLHESIVETKTTAACLLVVQRQLEKKRKLLESYATKLDRFDSADVRKMGVILPRLRRLREESRPLSAADVGKLHQLQESMNSVGKVSTNYKWLMLKTYIQQFQSRKHKQQEIY